METADHDSPADELAGSCLCGRVRYRTRGPFLDMLHCHCTDCRKTHGAAFVTSLGVGRDRLAITGAEHLRAFTAPSGTRRSFCVHCGAKIAVENDTWDAVYVPAGTIETPMRQRPQLHMYVRSKVAWHDIADGLPAYDTSPEDGYRGRIPPLER